MAVPAESVGTAMERGCVLALAWFLRAVLDSMCAVGV
jgi:hypothetical protein